jgi:hypothetical protein
MNEPWLSSGSHAASCDASFFGSGRPGNGGKSGSEIALLQAREPAPQAGGQMPL